MSEGNVYEAACEVREALNTIGAVLRGIRDSFPASGQGQMTRREHWAGELFCDLVQEANRKGLFAQKGGNFLPAELAERAWNLANVLDEGDPLADTFDLKRDPPEAGPEGIDLSAPMDD